MNASSFTVKWYRAEPNAVVHIYQNSADVTGEQDPGYKGRTELVKNELMDGKVSLKLKGIRVSDQGFYKCFVASPLWFDESPIEVIVAGIGRDPLIYVDKYENKGVKLSCKSSGWYPKPEVTWKDANNQSVRSETEVIEERNDGLFEVTSNIVTEEPSHKFTCHIKNSVTQIVQESSLLIGGDFFTGISDWLALTLLLLVQILATICISYWYWKRKKNKPPRTVKLGRRIEKADYIIKRCRAELEFLDAQNYSTDITLDQQTAHPELIVSENCKTVAYCSNLALENSKRYSFTCVLGSDGFVSWRHYWEVKVEDKLKWIVGVARESADKKVGITVSPACGYWALCLRNGTDYRALTSPSIKLTLSVKPSKIGVYLDYEGGRVSFYNVDDKSLIYMFEDKFTEKMFPFFNPCVESGKPLRIPSPQNHFKVLKETAPLL
ncbi:butyrophilin-like protein 9 [Latimeria chalumnae]|uniref:butyrophilin-like protein 9 n=1 Tax=Latimeria chalumnae TaxID=7897 RepID=UPI0006D92E6B|nr:PREDICTED: butyrophilin-like protein 9 isoform X2 [Latimeria chalumnae]|eukprot:XP_014348873.1 PREDICTED: butyrophilin-like protein 9 isoform X2 [Latimeria chalumnae]